MNPIRAIIAVILLAVAWFPVAWGAGAEVCASTVPSQPCDSLAIAEIDSILNTIDLDEVIVTAPIKEREIRGDTTIFNADAYRLRDGAYLQELVRLIPGMEYDKASGSLTYYGTPLGEVMVNGEKFFGSNIVAALENMPVELICQLKVYDKASEEEEFTGVRTGRKNHVLDIRTKQKFDGMLMAGAAVGMGNEKRKEARLFGHYFEMGGNNYSLNADIGNKNILSGFSGNRHDSMYGSLYKKIKKINVNVSASYNNSINGDRRSNYVESYMVTGNKYRYSADESHSKNRSLNLSGGISGEIFKKTHLSLQGSFGYARSRSENGSHSAVFNTDPALDIKDPFGDPAYGQLPPDHRVNEDRSSSSDRNTMRNYNVSFSLARRLNDSGSSLSLSVGTGADNSRGKSFSLSEIRYYQLLNAAGGDSVLYRNQYRLSPTRLRNYSVGLAFNQAIGKDFSLNAGYKYVEKRQRSERLTYDLSPFMDESGAPAYLPQDYLRGYVDSLSNHSFSHTVGHQIDFSINYIKEHLRIMGSVAATPQRQTLDQKTGSMSGDTVRSSVSLSTSLNIDINRDKYSLDFSYSGWSDQPALSLLMSMTDNSNPLSVTHGNPALKPSYRQDFRVSFRLNKFFMNADLAYSNIYNDVTQAVFYDPESGVSESYPVNINGNWSMRSSLWFHHRLKKVTFSGRLGGNYSHRVSLLNEGQAAEPVRSVTLVRTCDSNLSATYMGMNTTLTANFDWRFNNSRNRLRDTRSYMRDYGCGLTGNQRFLNRFEVGGNFRYSLSNSSIAGVKNNEETLLDFNCSWSFLKDKCMKLAFEWNDILNRKKSISRGSSPTGIYEMRSMIIGSYFMFTLSYDFRRND